MGFSRMGEGAQFNPFFSPLAHLADCTCSNAGSEEQCSAAASRFKTGAWLAAAQGCGRSAVLPACIRSRSFCLWLSGGCSFPSDLAPGTMCLGASVDRAAGTAGVTWLHYCRLLSWGSGDNSLWGTERMEGLLDLSSVDFWFENSAWKQSKW